LSCEALYNARLIVDMRIDVERYEIQVRSLANQTLASTLTGVATFSVSSRIKKDIEHNEVRVKALIS
jgi:hypothetical protein